MGSSQLSTWLSILLGTLLGAGAGLIMHYPDLRDGSISSGRSPSAARPATAGVASGRASAAPSISADERSGASAPALPSASQPEGIGAPADAGPPVESAAQRVGPGPTLDAGTAGIGLPSFAPYDTLDEVRLGSERCGEGDGTACLRLGASYAEGVGAETDANTARRLRQRAIGILVRQCHDVDAAACLAVARLYRDGIGLQPSDSSALALIERAKLLCRVTQQAACSGIPAEGAKKGKE